MNDTAHSVLIAADDEQIAQVLADYLRRRLFLRGQGGRRIAAELTPSHGRNMALA